MHVRRLIAAMLVAAGFATSTAIAAPCGGFTDVDDTNPLTAPFCENVEWIKNRGITLGCTSPTLFCPFDNVSRLQMAAFLNRLGNVTFQQGGNAYGAVAVIGTTDNQPLDVRVGNARVMRYQPNATSPNLIGGSPVNAVAGGVRGGIIAGGGAPMNDPNFGEHPNRVSAVYGAVGGGAGNEAGDPSRTPLDAAFATVGGGFSNQASNTSSTVAGGSLNTASGVRSVVGGGSENMASGDRSSVVGGGGNVASGDYSTAAGHQSTAGGDYSVALGHRAKAPFGGNFVFADNHIPSHDFSTNGPNNFRVRATGGVRFVVGINIVDGTTTWSCGLVDGDAGWVCSSDRNQKRDLVRLDGEAVLDKLVAMPVYAWSPKGANAHIRHYGPTAQDFHAAFGLGDTDLGIGQQDADGVALAAIQGLHARSQDKEAVLRAQAAEIEVLKAELARLRGAVELLLAREPVGRDASALLR